ncbi:probable pectinesterase 29 [Gossypium raimondii]|uniref:probable pectinesterase 29 n=1 Tax=Gossypium raimondii TaxID=29730 RepID=UPI00227A0282|nr:probable pectinesterase 29 [Gossypium raimondii]
MLENLSMNATSEEGIGENLSSIRRYIPKSVLNNWIAEEIPVIFRNNSESPNINDMSNAATNSESPFGQDMWLEEPQDFEDDRDCNLSPDLLRMFFNFFLNSSVLVLVLLMSTKTDGQVRQTIIVDQSGHGSFTTIQNAIDSVPSNNEVWTLIHVKAGIYNEKVTIPRDKPRILLQGESDSSTIVQFGDGGDSIRSSTLSLYADDFVAMDITFKNTYNLEPGKPITWAPAALINADMAAFYRCGFVSVQDTLTDSEGRHYFENCYIEGAVDFIWGNGRSIYQGCNLNVTASAQRSGMAAYITAQARDSIVDHSGFVFKEGWIFGTGPAYLGRAYKPYARVLFYRTRMSGIIVPQGWAAWNYVGKENSIVYAEVDCTGAGANKSKRVAWEKKLSSKDLSYLLNINTFINNGGWIQRQPKGGS